MRRLFAMLGAVLAIGALFVISVRPVAASNGGAGGVPQTATVIATSVTPSIYGASVTFTATVTSVYPEDGIPTGTVDFYESLISLSGPIPVNGSGVATYTISTLSAGTHDVIYAYFTGSGAQFAKEYQDSASDSITQTVNPKALTVTALTAGLGKTYDGGTSVLSTVTFSITGVISPDVVTPVTYSAAFDNKNYGTTHVVHVTSISLTGAGAGNYTWNAASDTPATVTISKKLSRLPSSPFLVTSTSLMMAAQLSFRPLLTQPPVS